MQSICSLLFCICTLSSTFLEVKGQRFWRNPVQNVNPQQTWSNPPQYGLYPYQTPQMSYNSYPQQQPLNQYYQYPQSHSSFNPYQPPSSHHNWQALNNPSNPGYSSFSINPSSNYNQNNNQDNVIWTSQWTEWLPASKVKWNVMKDRTVARHNLKHISPKSFSGTPSQQAMQNYQGLVKNYFQGVFPSKDDIHLPSNYEDVKHMGGLVSVHNNYNRVIKMNTTCDKYCCYRKCRLDMVGGGRCTSGGCVCYESFFIESQMNHETFGAPASIVYPEDKIWYQLGYKEQDQIRNATKSHLKNPRAISYMCEQDIRKEGSARDKKLAGIYEILEKLDNRTNLNLAKSLLIRKYRLHVPEDLIQIAYDEIMDEKYYLYRKNKRVEQMKTRAKYVREWWRKRNWQTHILTFKQYVRREVRLEERLGPNEIKFEEISNFFEHRGGFIRHPRTYLRYRINIYDDIRDFHSHIHEVEDRIADKLHFIPKDQCCVRSIEEEKDENIPNISEPEIPDSWDDEVETTTRPDYDEGSGFTDDNIDDYNNDFNNNDDQYSDGSVDDYNNIDNDYNDANNDDDFGYDDEEEEVDDIGFGDEEEEVDDIGFGDEEEEDNGFGDEEEEDDGFGDDEEEEEDFFGDDNDDDW